MLLCPFDATELKVVNRSGIEIDWCPVCKGVWLERGELDKLIDQVAGGPTPPSPTSPEPGYVPPGPQAPAPAPAPGPGYTPHPAPAPMSGYGQPGDYRPPRDRAWSSDSWDDDRDRGGRRRKRKSLLSEIFDF